jgi:sugar phosphate isomerase/epimerase
MVAFAITPDREWAATTEALVDATRAIGFDALGIVADRVDAGAAATFGAAGVRCHEVLAVVVGDDARATITTAESVAAAAEQMRAEWVLTTFAVGLGAATESTIDRCGAVYADADVGMAIEFSPFRAVATIPDALDVAAVAGRRCRAGVLVDSWHFSVGESTWHDLQRVPLDLIAYVQFADALPACSDRVMDETMNRRALPGDGVLELDRFASTLLERGWDGCVSAEILNSELRRLPAEDLLPRIARATERYWR